MKTGETITPEARRRILLETELAVLRAMCQGARDGRVWAKGISLLVNYPFLDPHHQIVFDTLRELPSDDPEKIRLVLAAWLTRKGFPDVDVDSYFQPHGLTAAAAVSMMHALLASALGDRLPPRT